MFLEEVKQSFIAQAKAMAEKRNEIAVEEYLGACRNWAARTQQGVGAAGPEPQAGPAIEAVVNFDGNWSIEFRPTGYPVSGIPPSNFLPKHKTDENAIGFPVGGPIPDQPGRYYDFSTAASWVGRKATINGKKYEFQGITAFNRAWVEVGNVA